MRDYHEVNLARHMRTQEERDRIEQKIKNQTEREKRQMVQVFGEGDLLNILENIGQSDIFIERLSRYIRASMGEKRNERDLVEVGRVLVDMVEQRIYRAARDIAEQRVESD